MPDLMHPLAAPLRRDGDSADAFLMLHGWTGTPAHFRLAADHVTEQGHGVLVPRLAGHGTTIHHMMDTGWEDWVASAVEGLLGLQADYDRVHVVGLSMGGIIGLLIAATNNIASITTISSPQRLHSKRVWMARFYRGSRRIRSAERADPPRDEVAKYWIQYDDSPVGTIGDLLDLIDAARSSLPRITAPAIVIQSRTDETVHPSSGEILFHGLGSQEKRLVWLERSRHVALLDEERSVIHEAIASQAADVRPSV